MRHDDTFNEGKTFLRLGEVYLRMLKKRSIIILFALCLLAAMPVLGAEQRVPELRVGSYQTCLLQAVQESFNLNEDGADKLLKKAISLEPDDPMAYALEAMLHMFAYEMCFTQEQLQKEKNALFQYSEEAHVRGEKRIARFPKDSQAHLAMSLAKVAKVYWAMKEKRYFVMAQETSNIWDYLEAAKSANPNNYDVDFLMGLLHYHIDQFRGLTGILSSWLITEGNRPKGIAEISTAMQKGYLLREVARTQMASIYQLYEKQPAKALPIIQELRSKYPENYNYYFSYGLVLLELGRFTEAEGVAAAIDKNIKTGKPPYVPELQ
ncbi:hypothetical protein EG832_20745, partial [bacterium]|nr:hypothetical protein [bacterium]